MLQYKTYEKTHGGGLALPVFFLLGRMQCFGGPGGVNKRRNLKWQ
jgi:hypothetical protein